MQIRKEDCPLLVRKELERIGCNAINTIEVDSRPGKVLYELYITDSKGRSVPTGLPYVVDIIDNKIERVPLDEIFSRDEKE